jgi:hypothetical protein
MMITSDTSTLGGCRYVSKRSTFIPYIVGADDRVQLLQEVELLIDGSVSAQISPGECSVRCSSLLSAC